MMKEIMMAGPANCAAARPVSTKIPVPMDAADAEEDQVQGAEGAFKLPVFVLGLDLCDRFAQEDAPNTYASHMARYPPTNDPKVRRRHASLVPGVRQWGPLAAWPPGTGAHRGCMFDC